jgi:hypothetical protein
MIVVKASLGGQTTLFFLAFVLAFAMASHGQNCGFGELIYVVLKLGFVRFLVHSSSF